jgi:arylsulfatase A-like enzyme
MSGTLGQLLGFRTNDDRRERPSRGAAGWALLLLLAVSCARPAPPSVLLITLDTTRADRLGCYGRSGADTPRLDALARRGVLFEQAYATTPLTLPSHASILTGTYPLYHGVRDNGSYRLDPRLTSLAELFAERGYRTGAFVGAYPVASHFGLAQGFEIFDEDFTGSGRQRRLTFSERPAERVVEAAGGWLGTLEDGEQFFAWVHVFDPHFAYAPPEPYATRYRDDPYQGEIAYVDHCLGRLFDRLVGLGRLETTLVVVVADHGEALGQHGEGTHSPLIYNSTMWVPLLIAGPRIPPSGRLPTTVSLIDIVPTLTELADLPTPDEVQGVSLVPLWRGAQLAPRAVYLETLRPRLHYGWSDLRGVVANGWKLIEAPEAGGSAFELYNVVEDPEERNDLSARSADRVVELREQLNRIRDAATSAEFDADRRMTAEDERHLRALGYVSGTTRDAERRAHPRDKVRVLQGYVVVSNYIDAGRLEDALRLLDEIEALDPDGLGLHEKRGLVFKELGRSDPAWYERALDEFGRALAINDRLDTVWNNLAEIHWLLGDPQQALRCYERARAIASPPLGGKLNYAGALAAAGRTREALEHYRAAIEQHPDLFGNYPEVAGIVEALEREERSATP